MEQKETIIDWTIPDSEGNIHVPDELDPLINKIGFQIRFHTISGKNEVETICDIAYICQKFFAELAKGKEEEITILREQLRGTREELAEARKQREEAMEQMGVLRGRIKTIGRSLEENHKQAQASFEADQKSMKALFDENTRLKELVKEAWMAGGAHQSDWHYFYERGDRVTTISLDEWLKSKGL